MALIQKAFSDIITFSRSSNATRVGPNGLVQYAPHNLILQSQTFDNASWTKTSSSVTANAAASPDGTVTADKLITNAATSNGYVTQGVSLTSGTTYTFSCYAKTAGATNVRLRASGSGTWASAIVDLTTGVISGTLLTGTATATNVGNGWYRITITAASDLTGSNTFWVYDYNTGDGINGIFIWGAQLAVGPLALDYTPTTTAAVYGPRFDYDGSGVTSVDPIARNLLTYSEQFDNGAWFKGLATITSNALSAPDGTVTADLATAGAGTGVSEISGQISSGTFANNSVVTFSVYFKAGTKDSVTLSYNVASGNYAVAVFDLSGVSVSQTAQLGTFVLNGSSITSVGSGWFRCSISFTSSNFSATTNVPFVGIAPAKTGNTFNSNGRISATYAGTETVYLWGAQVELGNTATGYMVSGATNGFRAVPVVSGSATARGLLVEEQRTNLLTYSDDFSNAAWTKIRSSITPDTIVAPDGTLTGDKLVDDLTASNTHQVQQTIASTSGTVYTITAYMKAGERIFGAIRFAATNGVFADDYAYFNLSTGTLGTVDADITASITSVGNGWYRCRATRTALATANGVYILGMSSTDGNPNYTGDGYSGIFIWGAQVEVGAFATSYIPTLASTVTRSADVASVNTLSPWFNASAGTLYAEGAKYAVQSGGRVIAELGDGSASNIAELYTPTDSANGAWFVASGGVTSASISVSNTFPALTVGKIAGSYEVNSFQVAGNGSIGTRDTSGAVPVSINTLFIGKFGGGTSNQWNGWIRRIAYYPRALTNAELQALTA